MPGASSASASRSLRSSATTADEDPSVGSARRESVAVEPPIDRHERPALRLAQARTLGFAEFETWGESAPGEPFYLFVQNGDLSIDIGVTDEADGRLVARVWKIAFQVEGREAPAAYQFELPCDTYTYSPARLDGIGVQAASPLALYQIRAERVSSRVALRRLGLRQDESLELSKQLLHPWW